MDINLMSTYYIDYEGQLIIPALGYRADGVTLTTIKSLGLEFLEFTSKDTDESFPYGEDLPDE